VAENGVGDCGGCLLLAVGCGGSGNAGNGSASNTYVYVAQAGPLNGIGDVAQFRMANDGTLLPLTPATVTAGGTSDDSASSVIVNPAGTYLFAQNLDSETTSEFQIAVDGTITTGPAMSFGFFSMAFTHFGQLAVVENTAGVSSYSVSSSGDFALINTVPAGNTPGSVAFDSSGRFVYVASESDSTISEYTISASGVLAPLQTNNTVSSGWLPFAVATSPGGFLYSVDYGAGTITEYSIDATTGALTKGASFPTGSVPAPPGGPEPRWITFDATGAFAYVGNVDEDTVSQFVVDAATGALTKIGPDVATGVLPTQVVIDPSGKFAFTADGGGTISEFKVNSDGTLTPNGSIQLGGDISGFPFAIVFAQR
jgi:6-phosphogluconolactonase (cycloisomerase 2 family)